MAVENVPIGYTPTTFHEQSGVSDWRMMSWGPHAVYSTSSPQEASQLLAGILEGR